MADKFKSFKIELRSVLLGMKNGASVKQLHKEYELRMLRAIPFQEFGFRNVVQLIENLPDVAYLDDSTGELRVHAVPDENTAHIARMVSMQKVCSRRTVLYTRCHKTPYRPHRPQISVYPVHFMGRCSVS